MKIPLEIKKQIQEIQNSEPRAAALRVAVANQKGGVGKTDVCVNLASCLAKKGKKVLLVDLDPQANSTDYLTDQTHELTSFNLLMDNEIGVADVVQKTKLKNLDIVPSSIGLSTAQMQLASDVNMQFKLEKKLRALDGYDYIFMDTPPSIGVLTINALTAAHEVLIPIQVHYFAMDGVAKLMDTIDSVKGGINPELKVRGAVLTMYDRRNKLSGEVEKTVRSSFQGKVFKTMIPVNVKLAESPSHHKPIIKYASGSTGAKAYRALATEFLK